MDPTTKDVSDLKLKVVTWKTARPDTYMEVEICGCKYKCLLDTGCDHSIIPRRLIPTAPIQPTSVRVTAANGTDITILGHVTIDFTVHNLALTAALLVAEDVNELILGYDWLLLQGVDWNFRQCQLVLQYHSPTDRRAHPSAVSTYVLQSPYLPTLSRTSLSRSRTTHFARRLRTG